MVQLIRNIAEVVCPFVNHFKGFGRVNVVRRVLGQKTETLLKKLKVEFSDSTLYMRVDDLDGHLVVNPDYMINGDTTDIYLDVVHELVHVKQFSKGKSSNKRVDYVERPLEIEAYKITVNEARDLGLDDSRILGYLDSELVNQDELKQLARALCVRHRPFASNGAVSQPPWRRSEFWNCIKENANGSPVPTS